MSLRAAFLHLDGVVSAVTPPTAPTQGFSCLSGLQSDRDVAEMAGAHRACEWRIGAFSHPESATSHRMRARVALRIRYEADIWQQKTAMELDIDEDVSALIDACTRSASWGAPASTIRGIVAVDESPGVETITVKGRAEPVARIVSIPFEILHGRCSA